MSSLFIGAVAFLAYAAIAYARRTLHARHLRLRHYAPARSFAAERHEHLLRRSAPFLFFAIVALAAALT
jgi:hypothetical protein